MLVESDLKWLIWSFSSVPHARKKRRSTCSVQSAKMRRPSIARIAVKKETSTVLREHDETSLSSNVE